MNPPSQPGSEHLPNPGNEPLSNPGNVPASGTGTEPFTSPSTASGEQNLEVPTPGRVAPAQDVDASQLDLSEDVNAEEEAELLPKDQWNRFHWATPLLTLWKVWAALAAFAFSAVVQILDEGFGEILNAVTGISRTTLLIVIGVIFALSSIVILFAWLVWRKQRYVLAPSGVHYQSGVFSVTHRHVRWDRIQSVEIKQGVIPRILGLGSIVIDSASGSGGDLSLGLLKMNEIQGLRSQILRIAAAARTGSAIDLSEPEYVPALYDPDDVYENERPFYVLPTGRLVGSLALSSILVITLLSIASIIGLMIAFDDSLSIGLLVALFGALATAWGQFNLNHGLKLFLTSDGIRIRRGLTTTTTQTIPPRRIHAVTISQPTLWRWKDWWKLEVLIAGAFGSDEIDSTSSLEKSVILPVGSRKDALDLLWTIIPDIGVEDVRSFFDDALVGVGPSPHFLGAPKNAKWLDPVVQPRNGIALTPTVAAVRSGRLSRRLTVAFHGHWQGLKTSQGPIQRRLELATLKLNLVSGPVHWDGKNFSLTDVHNLLEEERNWGLRARAADDRESIEEWARRVGVS